MPTAYSYKRFSSEKQAKGDSLRRQTEMAERYVHGNPQLNLLLDTERHLTDEAMSAYKGTHKTKGALGVFIRAVEDEQIEKGSYLLVESLDRLSRQQPIDAMTQLIDLVKCGIIVVTLNDQKVYSTETLKGAEGTFVLMASLIGMARAFEESDTKGRRVKAAWQNKFDKIKDGVQLTKRVPFWLTPDRKIRSDKASIVKRIYNEYSKGWGTTVIVKGLNRDGVAPPTEKITYWNVSTVKKILKSRAPVGSLVTADGNQHDSYYPAIISDELWFMCQLPESTGGRARARVESEPKPLAGLLRCTCVGGGSIVRATKSGRIKKDGTRTIFESLVCVRARDGVAGCVYKSVPYGKVLKAIEGSVTAIRNLSGSTNNEDELRNIDGYLDDLSNRTTTAYELLKISRSIQARDVYQELAKELQEIKAERQQIVETVGTVGSGVMESLMKKPEMSNSWLRKVFKGGVLDVWKERLTMTLQNGKTLEIDLNASQAFLNSDAL